MKKALLFAVVTGASATDFRLFGANTDAGRVEVLYNDTWGNICYGDHWGMMQADAVCKKIGFAKAIAAGKWVAGGIGAGDLFWVSETEKGCQDLDCLTENWPPPETGYSCDHAAFVACVSGGADPPAVSGEISTIYGQDARNLHNETLSKKQQCIDSELVAPCWFTDIPDPFEAMSEAYVYDISEDASKIMQNVYREICSNETSKKALSDLFKAKQLTANAVGINVNRTLFEGSDRWSRRSKMDITKLFTETNDHFPLHWEIDEAQRHIEPPVDKMSLDLREDGIAVVDNYGIPESEIDEMMELANTMMTPPIDEQVTSSVSGGAILTSRVRLPAIDRLLQNQTIINAISSYLGDDVTLNGYKITRLSNNLKQSNQYIAGKWHHDRVGRRIKMFVFLHDIDCEEGRPTLVAQNTNNILFYKTESFTHSRFNDAWVRDNYNITKACGKKGGGFLFDTHTIHKGTEFGELERTTVIIEFHNTAKCPFVTENNLGLPCPSGDSFMLSQRLQPRFQLPDGTYETSTRQSIELEDGLSWRLFPYDVIPPIPPSAYLKKVSSKAQGVCFANGQIGTAEFDGPHGGGCLTSNGYQYGEFHLLLQRKNETSTCDPSLKDTFFKYANKYITQEDEANFELVTNLTISELLSDMSELDDCFFESVVSTERFVPHELNTKGLHLVRSIVAGRLNDVRRKKYSSHPDYEAWNENGYLLKDFNEMKKDNYSQLREILIMASAGEKIQDDLSFFPRVVTHLPDDTQTQAHVDTFHTVIKMWVYPSNITLEHGPLNVYPGTHRNTLEKLRWMYKVTSANTTADLVKEASLRLWDDESKELLPKPMAMLPVFPEWTLIIADTSSIHNRGFANSGVKRLTLRPSGGENDGGVRRRNPFHE
eukprot:TRINITY_DN13639_c0_g1_i1.p1 TRINITY_DN13639_c0_g1~~TRINITY_DN13639_c0_g1_i1.p1  ORF type:complete len:883 (+),score=176.56 TRINITY_DN13639_c0_g1_i1:100-2748(+)